MRSNGHTWTEIEWVQTFVRGYNNRRVIIFSRKIRPFPDKPFDSLLLLLLLLFVFSAKIHSKLKRRRYRSLLRLLAINSLNNTRAFIKRYCLLFPLLFTIKCIYEYIKVLIVIHRAVRKQNILYYCSHCVHFYYSMSYDGYRS